MNPEAGRIWRENCFLANEVAERWKEQALLMRTDRDEWKRVAESRVRLVLLFALTCVSLGIGGAAFFLARNTDRMPGAACPGVDNVGVAKAGRP